MLTHLDDQNRGQMVDISDKRPTIRTAIARGCIRLIPDTINAIKEIKNNKGDVLAIAQVAAIQAVKKTPDFIPMAHPILISKINVDFYFKKDLLYCEVEVKCEGKTGVEMEALTGCSAGLLTIYDMCKSIDKSMTVENIYLVKKTGGKSGDYERKEEF